MLDRPDKDADDAAPVDHAPAEPQATEAVPPKRRDASVRAEEAFTFYASLPAKERRYSVVAQQFGVSLASVKLWASRDRWRPKVAERDARVVRRAADKVETAEIDQRARYLKIIEAVLMKVVSGIATGTVKATVSDVERLIRLKVFLEEPEAGSTGPQQIVVNLIRTGGITDAPPGDGDV